MVYAKFLIDSLIVYTIYHEPKKYDDEFEEIYSEVLHTISKEKLELTINEKTNYLKMLMKIKDNYYNKEVRK